MNKELVMNELPDLSKKYTFSAQYVPDHDEFRSRIIAKSIIPYQVEFQPPPNSLKKICWLECPYCYGASADDSSADRMPRELGIKVLKEIADGGVKKIIFAGYATDPLNSAYIEDLLEIAIERKMIFGFNTKALKVSSRLLKLLERTDIQQGSYISLSVDAGSNKIYNLFHGVKSNPKIYDNILANTAALSKSRAKGGSLFDISAAYLVNRQNWMEQEVTKFIHDFKGVGCNLIRFTFPQPPREIKLPDGIIPNSNDVKEAVSNLTPIININSSDSCKVMIVDADKEHGIYYKPRTTPCFARWIYPTVGYDGWLYHCSQTGSPNFRPFALGDLSKEGFWSLFYKYNENNLGTELSECAQKMDQTACRCDRKMHLTNQKVINSNAFNHEINIAKKAPQIQKVIWLQE